MEPQGSSPQADGVSGAQPTPTVRLPCPRPLPPPRAVSTWPHRPHNAIPGPQVGRLHHLHVPMSPPEVPFRTPLAATGRGQGDDPCRAVRKQGLVSPGVDEVASRFWSSHSGIHQDERAS